MQSHTHWTDIPDEAKGCSAAIGNFDGVHLGHRRVIDLARQHGPLGLVTFEPHPREYFAPGAPPFRLMNAEAKANRLAKLGVEQMFQLPFDADMAAMTPEEFARKVIKDGLGLTHVVVGADFCFGSKRAGKVEDLKRFGDEMGFGVTVAELLETDGGVSSSSAIRVALAEGRPKDAANMLGHWHRIEGMVGHGDKRGRDLGFPTANMSIAGLHAPKFGVYAVLVDVLTGPNKGNYKGAASLGVKPTFGANLPCLETFVFDFSGNLYDEHLSVAFVDYLRPELVFTDLEALIVQMNADCERARQILGALE
ncbi:bifunctional riboflavin kinase/FAD synthetase [Celeribacter baekdonensis]|uniref:Riboflavin biosynthesis protein n=1 Tax=Celeribacter baekdonensis TaxID=875171 RepID=A0A2R4M493_9RHOB|nr:bifunctional riboflavin kinase/FAD synthetase [Celeribacter baekdonensis]AVW91917.1 bifunctional riboflavin kinase/FMN adenylyltransferase [Celeribacter baekdonensis]|tara:strand:+ start:91449 stop:92375 length:927 start_codon:yes stop_codon:yes gene_type:complete